MILFLLVSLVKLIRRPLGDVIDVTLSALSRAIIVTVFPYRSRMAFSATSRGLVTSAVAGGNTSIVGHPPVRANSGLGRVALYF